MNRKQLAVTLGLSCHYLLGVRIQQVASRHNLDCLNKIIKTFLGRQCTQNSCTLEAIWTKIMCYLNL